jgi:hypothetical protein
MGTLETLPLTRVQLALRPVLGIEGVRHRRQSTDPGPAQRRPLFATAPRDERTSADRSVGGKANAVFHTLTVTWTNVVETTTAVDLMTVLSHPSVTDRLASIGA